MNESMDPLISVIVPIYNVEKYIKKCVKSIIDQSYSNLEIILVNDGSTDGSSKICEAYSKEDKRIKCIYKENGGLSDARNKGMQCASGDYVTFIDGDDFITVDYIKYLYTLLKKYDADISVCNYQKIYKNQDIRDLKNEKVFVFQGSEGLEALLYQKYYTMSAWAKLYRKEMFKDIEFPTGKVHEDVGTIYKVINNANKTVYGSSRKYGYVQRDKSIVNSEFKLDKMDYIEFTKEIIRFISCEKGELYHAAVSRHFSACFQIAVQINKEKPELRKAYHEIIQEIYRYRIMVLSDNKTRKINRVAAILALINVEFAVSVLRWISKRKTNR